MLLTPKQMVAMGDLYRERGRANGRQIVPASWVDASCVPRTTSVWDADRRYGYGWWIQDSGAARPASPGGMADSTSSCSATWTSS